MKDPLREEIIRYLLTNQEKFYRLAFSYVHNPDAALDVVQNAIVKALEHYNSIRNIKYIKTWFYRVLVNECLTALQKEKESVLMNRKIYSAYGTSRSRKTIRQWRSMSRCKNCLRR